MLFTTKVPPAVYCVNGNQDVRVKTRADAITNPAEKHTRERERERSHTFSLWGEQFIRC